MTIQACNEEEFEEQLDVYLVDDRVHLEVIEVLLLEYAQNQQHARLQKKMNHAKPIRLFYAELDSNRLELNGD